MLNIGEQFLNYRIIRLIGEGGMASVFEGQNIRLTEKKVAIKVLNPILTTRTDIKQRFENEAKIMCKLRNPYIISADDYIENEKVLAIVMEYVEGKPLNECIPENGFKEQEANDIFLKILEGFEYAHKQGIVHRDIKPSNVMLLADNTPKILDFGIAKIIEQSGEKSQTGSFMGTISYMSPEQVKDSKHIDHRSDIYALGVMYYVLLLGKKPYNENTTSQFEIQTAIVKEPLPDLDKFFPHTKLILEKATEKDPNKRFNSCQEFIEAIKNPQISATQANKNTDSTQIDTQKPKNQDSTQIDHHPTKTNSASNTQKNLIIQEDKTNTKSAQNDTEKKKKKATPFWIYGMLGFMLVGGIGTFLMFYNNSNNNTQKNQTANIEKNISNDETAKTEDAKTETAKIEDAKTETAKKTDNSEKGSIENKKENVKNGKMETKQEEKKQGYQPNDQTNITIPQQTPQKMDMWKISELLIANADYADANIEGFSIGGYKDVFAKITNNSPYTIGKAIVRIKISKRNGELYQTDDVSFTNIVSGQTQKLSSKDCRRGTKLRAELQYFSVNGQEWKNPN